MSNEPGRSGDEATCKQECRSDVAGGTTIWLPSRGSHSLFHDDDSVFPLHSSSVGRQVPVLQPAPNAQLPLVVLHRHVGVYHLQGMDGSVHLPLAQTYPGKTTAEGRGEEAN